MQLCLLADISSQFSGTEIVVSRSMCMANDIGLLFFTLSNESPAAQTTW
jgi:hypothetical protein